MKRDNEDKCLDDEIKLRKTDGELRAEIKVLMYGDQPDRLKDLDKDKRNEIMRKIKEIDGVTLRRIASVTGLSLSFVYKA
jgi:DNA invertase Pin-like site-specific DNA recombinase